MASLKEKTLPQLKFAGWSDQCFYVHIQAGILVIPINPCYTSQTCHVCLHIGLRSAKNFKCGNCGIKWDADFNGAKMIALKGLSVSQPRDSELLSCSVTLGLPKASRL